MSQVAMFSKTGSSDFPDYLKCMVTGPPKSGKTTLLGTVPNILILDTEPHANNLQSVAHLDIPFKSIRSTDELRQAQFVLSQETFRKQAAQALGLPDIEAVGIDTLDTLQVIMKRERMREQRSNKFLRDDWSWLKEEMTAILESFLALPMHVFFIVHTKSENVGTEDNPRTVILPGLEGSIARQIAGMVGYSLLAFRKEEVKPDGSGKYTKYWLRAEGDETYEYLGNRAAGRLPDIIEPDFKLLLSAATANRPTNEHEQVQVQLDGLQTTGQIGQPPEQFRQEQGMQPTQQPAQQQPVAQNPGQPQAQPQAQPQQQPQGTPQAMPADDEPVNAAALTHVKKVYDACGLPFPEDKIKALNLGQARELVKMFRAIQQDFAEGKGPQGKGPVDVMVDHLGAMGWLPDQGQQQAKQVQPDVRGTIEQVKAYVGDDLARANEALQIESSGPNPRKTLVDWLESKGAGQSGQPVQTNVQNQAAPTAPPASESPVTSGPQGADEPPTEAQAAATVEQVLGGTVIGEEINPTAPCEECGNQIDDLDLAQLGKSRFGRVLCVEHYIAETKKK